MQIRSLHGKLSPSVLRPEPKKTNHQNSVTTPPAEVADQVSLSQTSDSTKSGSVKEFAMDALGIGMIVGAGATPGVGALINFLGAKDSENINGQEKVNNLHAFGMAVNAAATLAFLVNPVVSIVPLAVAGIATAAAFHARS